MRFLLARVLDTPSREEKKSRVVYNGTLIFSLLPPRCELHTEIQVSRITHIFLSPSSAADEQTQKSPKEQREREGFVCVLDRLKRYGQREEEHVFLPTSLYKTHSSSTTTTSGFRGVVNMSVLVCVCWSRAIRSFDSFSNPQKESSVWNVKDHAYLRTTSARSKLLSIQTPLTANWSLNWRYGVDERFNQEAYISYTSSAESNFLRGLC